VVGREPGPEAGQGSPDGQSGGGSRGFVSRSPPGQLVESDLKLSRSLGFWHYVSINIGAIIGAGWLLAPLGAAAFAGPLSIASWLVAAVLVIFMALAYAYLAGLAPRTGGVVRYPQMAHGDLVGFVTGVLYLLSISSLMPAEAIAVVSYASYYVHGLVTQATVLGQSVTVVTGKGMLLALAIIAIVFLINYFGVKLVGNVSLGLMVWKVLVPLIAIVALFALAFNPHNLTLQGPTQASSMGLTGAAAVLMAIPLTGIAYALLGFRQAVEYSGEGRSSSRDVPLAVITSVLIASTIFILLQVAFIGGLRWSAITVGPSNDAVPLTPGNWSGLAVSNIASAPLASELALAGLGALSVLLIIDAWVSPLGNSIVQMGNLARVVYGMAANGHLPSKLTSLNRYAVPGLGLLVALALGLAFMVPLPSWYAIGGYAVLTTLLTYVTGGTALGAFSRGGRTVVKVVGALGAMAAALLAYWAGMTLMIPVFMTLISGIAAYLLIRGVTGQRALLAIGVPYAATIAFVDYVLAVNVFYPISSGLTTSAQEVTALITISLALSAAETVIALIAYALIGGPEERKAVRSGAWFVALAFLIFLIDVIGPYGLSSVYGGSPLLPFPYDLVAVAAGAVTLYVVAVLTAP
jgi:amino acid transporter